MFYFLHSSFNVGNAFHISIRRSCLLSETLPLCQNLYHSIYPKTQKFTTNTPCKSNSWSPLSYCFFLNKFLLLPFINHKQSLCLFFLIFFSCYSHRSFPVTAFPCNIPQLELMLLMNHTWFFFLILMNHTCFFFLISTFRSPNFSGKVDRSAFLLLWVILSLSATLLSISLCLQHTFFDELCYWITMEQIDMFHYNLQGKMAYTENNWF